MQCIVHSVQRAVYSVQYSVYSVQLFFCIHEQVFNVYLWGGHDEPEGDGRARHGARRDQVTQVLQVQPGGNGNTDEQTGVL